MSNRELATTAGSPATFWPLADLSQGLADGVFSSVDLVRLSIDRIERAQPQLNAFATVSAATALIAAEAADARRAKGRSIGPLDGVPVAVKDMFDTSGEISACGSASRTSRVAERNSALVDRLQAAGACIVGKTHMVEFAFGAWGINPHLGTPWNPWDLALHRIPGGSSSGSAVAVAAGLVPVSIGSDTGGSVRTPAALNGVTGLKATPGAIDLTGALPLSASLDSVGMFARTANDTLTVLAGLTSHSIKPTPTSTLVGTTIAVLDERDFHGEVDVEIIAAYRKTQDVLAAAGARLLRRNWPFDVSEIIAAAGVIMAVDGWRQHSAIIGDREALIGPVVRARLLTGRDIDDTAYEAAMARHRSLVSLWPTWLGGAVALLTPTVPILASPVTDVDEYSTALGLFTRVGNVLGACGLSLPAGFSKGGLPIGMQLLGRARQEERLVAIGQVFEQQTRFCFSTPDLSALGL